MLDVQVRVAPNELEGINGLWRIAIDSQDKKVGESVTKLILQLHTDVDFGMEDQIPIFEDQFITSCFNIIAEQIKVVEARSPEENQALHKAYSATGKYPTQTELDSIMPVQEKRIIRCLKYIKMVI